MVTCVHEVNIIQVMDKAVVCRPSYMYININHSHILMNKREQNYRTVCRQHFENTLTLWDAIYAAYTAFALPSCYIVSKTFFPPE